MKRKFSSFFKSLVIELDKELYGPDNHLVEWHRTLTTQETDGFQVKRPGYKNVRCTILLLLDYQPLQFKLDQRLARLLGVHTQTRPVIVNALWQYVKTHRLQDVHEREYVACDKYLEQIFGAARLKLAEVPGRLGALLHPPDPIVINHVIAVEPPHDTKQTACYDIDVEVSAPPVAASPPRALYSRLRALAGGRHAEDADEQLPAEHGQPAGDPGTRFQDS